MCPSLFSWIYNFLCLHEQHCVPLLQPVMVNHCEWEVALAEPEGDTFSLRAVSHRSSLFRKRSVGIRRLAPAGSKVTMFQWMRSNFWFLNGLGRHVFPIWYGWKSDLNLGGLKSNFKGVFLSLQTSVLYEEQSWGFVKGADGGALCLIWACFKRICALSC